MNSIPSVTLMVGIGDTAGGNRNEADSHNMKCTISKTIFGMVSLTSSS